jgi:putative phage-type endonuclease
MPLTQEADRLVQHPLPTATNSGVLVPSVAKIVDWAKQFPQPEQKSKEWQEQRKRYCTASQHAAAIGECPYKSRQQSLREYGGLIVSKFTGNIATRHGEEHEDTAVAKYEKLRNVKVLLFGMVPFLQESDWLGGSPDGITTDGILIEVKCPYRRKPNGTVPPHYMPQIQSMMHGFNITECHFIEYVPETTWTAETFHVNVVPRCPKYWESALPRLRQFWKEVSHLRAANITEIVLDSPVISRKKRRNPRTEPRVCAIIAPS